MDNPDTWFSLMTMGGCACLVAAVLPVAVVVLMVRLSTLSRQVAMLQARLVTTETALTELRGKVVAGHAQDASRLAEGIRAAVAAALAATRASARAEAGSAQTAPPAGAETAPTPSGATGLRGAVTAAATGEPSPVAPIAASVAAKAVAPIREGARPVAGAPEAEAAPAVPPAATAATPPPLPSALPPGLPVATAAPPIDASAPAAIRAVAAEPIRVEPVVAAEAPVRATEPAPPVAAASAPTAALPPAPAASAAVPAASAAVPAAVPAPRPAATASPPLPATGNTGWRRPAASPSIRTSFEGTSPRPPDAGSAPPPDLFAAVRDWLFGGNTIVRIGVVLLFLGLAFLLRYASERVVVPVELRYAAVAAAGVGLLGLGWWARERRRAFGLLVQGAGVGVLYLTIFAAIRLNPLLTPEVGLSLLVVVAVLAGTLAVLQDAMALAVAGTLGGFAAPILASSGSNNHVGLFSYFLVLNAGVLGIAWYKAWRPLNVIGFLGTFGIGTAWGFTGWDSSRTATTEPFLLAFFLIYVAVPALFARRRLLEWTPPADAPSGRATLLLAARESSAIDGALLFGTPITAFGLHAAMVKDTEFALAFSALGMACFYLVLAAVLLRKERLGLLGEVFLSIGVVFVSLAIPLGLEPRWTSAAWAIEGAGIFWISARQGRPVGRVFALLLQIGAAISWLRTFHTGGDTMLGASWLGAALLGAGGLVDYYASRTVRKAPPEGVTPPSRMVEGLVLLAGLGFTALVAPCVLETQNVAIAWAVYGLALVELGGRMEEPLAQGAGVLVQLLGGLTFFGTLRGGDATGLAGGPRSMLSSLAIGAAGLGTGWALRPRGEDKRSASATLVTSIVVIFALIVLNVGMLFLLPWEHVPAAWAASGVATIWLGLWLDLPVVVVFGLGLEALCGVVGLAAPPDVPDGATAFAHAGFFIPMGLAIAAWVGAWRLHRNGGALGAVAPLAGWGLVLWGGGWWAWTWAGEVTRVFDGADAVHTFLGVYAASAALWAFVAHHQRWPQLAGLAASLVPVAALVFALGVANGHYAPLANLGAVAWLGAFAAHVYSLHRLGRRPAVWLPTAVTALHATGLWLFLAVAATITARLFEPLGDADSTWAWLGWAVVPAAWLVVVAKVPLRFWPFTEEEALYRTGATWPVVAWLLGWLTWSNLHTTGSAAPLPYMPLLNPLEIAYGGLGFAILIWGKERAPEGVAAGLGRALVLVFFLAYTCGVARAVHHVTDVPWSFSALLDSAVFQATLSLAWVVWALAQMVWANRNGRRTSWVFGAVLLAVVVGKLFLVELADTGSLTRIVSFLGVGAGLMLVGWFAPLPTRAAEEER